MKKLLLLFIASISLMFSACTQNSFKEYISAVNKTSNIQKGQNSLKMNVKNSYDLEGASKEEIRQLNYFKNLELKNNVKFDKKNKQIIARNYMNLGGMGFDTNYYQNKDQHFVKMPMLGKYFLVDDEVKNAQKEDIDNDNNLSDIFKELERNWISILKEKDVVTGKDTLISTEDGEVKVKEFKIQLNDSQLKKLLEKSLDVIEKEGFIEKIIKQSEYMNNNPIKYNETEVDINEGIKDFRNKLKDMKFESFDYKGYIDIDGYIIQEDIKVKAKFKDSKKDKITESIMEIQTKNWSIEKKQEFDFPKLNKTNILKKEELEQGIPYIFKDFSNKEVEEE
ncbi:hypothetical protein CLPU_9c01050 [Gottschalkia purinilytica]|uniref:Lipoprotein n=1 Tax=Gottschalkia purinilytica TaxID=1503 RepID=A0A0L0W9J0_GOTPU|nr:hypothetical protein [Gottschalkia purinilytica]KNF08209.1 hypothetical protein CLPU_9c01050 [Gottschalkia purinilytica]